ncbi:hypothetical protein VTO42DRAFT_5957 [Malbranchea cinnamomea]
MTKSLSRVLAAAIDGRLCNVYWRQGQLERLHAALVQNSTDIQEAIRHDTGNTIHEARIEYLLSLCCIKDHYTSLDPAKELQEEYRTANGVDSPDARQPAGIVYIEPLTYTLLYSVISPLAAALASGNCVILKLQNNLRRLTGLLRTLLLRALDPDIFDIAPTEIPASDLPPGTIRVLQSENPRQPKLTDCVSPVAARTVAVVDRTADLDEAAKALVTARFSFGGRSPYAPDVVLVNDFTVGKFLNAVAQQCIQFHSQRNVTIDNKKTPIPNSQRPGLLREFQDQDEVSLVISDSKGSVLELKNRNSTLLHRKVSEPVLVVHAVSSLDDAIDFANSNGSLLAAYHFADNPSCKYLGQFINAQVTFSNHIPGDILVGPAAPAGYSGVALVRNRYDSAWFTIHRPAFVNPAPRSLLVDAMIWAQEPRAELAKWQAEIRNLPVDKKRPSGEMLGFFERGVVTGASLFMTVLMCD